MPHEGIKGDHALFFEAFEGDNLMVSCSAGNPHHILISRRCV